MHDIFKRYVDIMSNHWGYPMQIKVSEYVDRIEIMYKQTNAFVPDVYPKPKLSERVFKIVFSCKDGKWHQSEPIFGKIIPAQKEDYIFE